jgi:hypothetical protein
MTGFWQRQFALPATGAQRWCDVLFGIGAPILCLYFDPAVFRPGLGVEFGYMRGIRTFSYLEIALSILVLAYYLARRKPSFLMAGALAGGALFSFLLGLAMLPLTLIGLLLIIGIFGLAPFVTSFVFLRNAVRCSKQRGTAISRKRAVPTFAFGFTLIVAVPLAAQISITKVESHAVLALQSGSEQDYFAAIRTLKRMRYDPDEIAMAYQRCENDMQRRRLARAYKEMTGHEVEARLAELTD